MIKFALRCGVTLAVACAGLMVLAATVQLPAQALPQRGDNLADRAGVPAAMIRAEYLPLLAREDGQGTFPNCRLGIGLGGAPGYDVASLYMGWYLDWTAALTPTRPNRSEYAQMIRLRPTFGGYTYTPSLATLYAIVNANPGSIWLIGNEPDSPFQDNLTPELYAEAYHDLYYLLKGRDPRAQIGAGGLVQPTPLRFQYLNRVWQTYYDRYGHPLPADLWNIHSYMLREITPEDPEAYPNGPLEVWGAYVPPGITATRGVLYNYSDQDNLTLFQQRIADFRTWMRDHGQRDKPLLITEYGILFPEDYVDEHGVPFSQDRAAAFFRSSSDLLLNWRDSTIGNPLDGNRLVQRWAWYSLADLFYGGALFDPVTKMRRPLGDAFAAYAATLSQTVDLIAPYAAGDPPALIASGPSTTATLKATIANQGNFSVTQVFTVTFWNGPPGSGSIIGTPQVVTRGLAGCGTAVDVRVKWSSLGVGMHIFYVQVDSSGRIAEVDESNNTTTGQVFIGTRRAYLPVVLHRP